MAWFYVIFAGLLEIPWVSGLKYSNSFLGYSLVAIIIAASFFLLMQSYKYLPVSTVYAVFTGMGTVGIAITEVIINHTQVSPAKIALITLILIGIIGLKLTAKGN